jgi:hypothetical protein
VSRAEQAAVLANRFKEASDATSQYLTYLDRVNRTGMPGTETRDAQADALAELAELVSWIVDQLEPAQ